jgi:16S rRNA G966 N2-methylase RsmD
MHGTGESVCRFRQKKGTGRRRTAWKDGNMLEEYYGELKKNQNPRENLSLLRSAVRDREARAALREQNGIQELLCGFLTHDDPKVRRNAALLIGDLELDGAAAALYEAYRKEETLFVRSAYPAALLRLDIGDYFDALKEHRNTLAARRTTEEERKHVAEELRELDRLITEVEGITHHTFTRFQKEHTFVLTTNREQRQVTIDEAAELSKELGKTAEQHPLGVRVRTKNMNTLTLLRTCREILLLLPAPEGIGSNPSAAAAAVWKAGVLKLLEECHDPAGAFYYRLEVKNTMELNERARFAKRFAAELARISGQRLINSVREYEVEIRLIEKKEGGYAAFIKLLTVPMRRFAYRKHALPVSVHPAAAAMFMMLAEPYLKEDAMVLDPFCGVGTMLIERDIRVPAGDKYGIDTFGDAVRMARENAAAAGEQINFINRDYFDFRHDELFDEIVTDMPMRGKKTKEEQDALYERFFDKSAQILAPGGVIVMYSNESGFVKKQLRLREDYRLLEEYCIREKTGFFLFVIQYQ